MPPALTLDQYKALRHSGLAADDIAARMAGAKPTYTGAPDQPLEANPLSPVDVGMMLPSTARLGAGIVGSVAQRLASRAGTGAAAEAAPSAAGAGGRVVAGAAKSFLRRVPVVGDIMEARAAEAARQAGTAGTGAIGSAEARLAAQAAAKEAARAEGKTIVGEHTRTLPKPKPRRKPEIGSAASRTRRGASKPELARRAKALEHVKSETKASGKVVGKIDPKAAAKGAAESRHSVRYFSESKGKYVDIEDLNQKHLEAAYRKLAAKNPKPKSIGKAILDALLDEAKHRLKTTDIHVGQL